MVYPLYLNKTSMHRCSLGKSVVLPTWSIVRQVSHHFVTGLTFSHEHDVVDALLISITPSKYRPKCSSSLYVQSSMNVTRQIIPLVSKSLNELGSDQFSASILSQVTPLKLWYRLSEATLLQGRAHPHVNPTEIECPVTHVGIESKRWLHIL